MEGKLNINFDEFAKNWQKVKEKMEKIFTECYKDPKWYSDFSSMHLTHKGIEGLYETTCCGDTDIDGFEVTWDELDQPIEYFKKRREEEIAESLRKLEEKEMREKMNREEEERQQYEKLHKKFANMA